MTGGTPWCRGVCRGVRRGLRVPAPPWRSVALAAAALLVAAAPGGAAALAFRRDAVLAAGEWWRIWTAHLAHASTYHLVWTLLPLLALGWLWEPVLRGRYWAVVLLAATCIGFGVLLLEPQLASYVGLSGVLNAIWVAGALQAARAERAAGRAGAARIYLAFVAAGAAKIAVEALGGVPLFTDPATMGARPVPLAHALGALAGAVGAYGLPGDNLRSILGTIEEHPDPVGERPAAWDPRRTTCAVDSTEAIRGRRAGPDRAERAGGLARELLAFRGAVRRRALAGGAPRPGAGLPP